MYSIVRPFLFSFDPEYIHHVSLSLLNYIPSALFKQPPVRPLHTLGLNFAHPVGLAAGFDKNGEYLTALSKLGFSFIEIGTVTPRPQRGNLKPRLFRLAKTNALINHLGFNNKGVDVLVENIKKADFKGILGINIGKNKDTPLEKSAEDYLFCLEKIYSYASYVTINISSPNTPDLRLLQQAKFLDSLLHHLQQAQQKLAQKHQRDVPLLVKISPDESDDALKDIADLCLKRGIAGIIATNTTCNRENISPSDYAIQQGGLSGQPLAARSTACLRLLKHLVGNDITLIGVGGIDTPAIAQEKLNAGASLLQLYTGLIYKGPQLVRTLVEKTHSN